MHVCASCDAAGHPSANILRKAVGTAHNPRLNTRSAEGEDFRMYDTHRDVDRGLVGSGIAGPGNWLRDRGMPSCVRVGVSFGCVSSRARKKYEKAHASCDLLCD